MYRAPLTEKALQIFAEKNEHLAESFEDLVKLINAEIVSEGENPAEYERDVRAIARMYF